MQTKMVPKNFRKSKLKKNVKNKRQGGQQTVPQKTMKLTVDGKMISEKRVINLAKRQRVELKKILSV